MSYCEYRPPKKTSTEALRFICLPKTLNTVPALKEINSLAKSKGENMRKKFPVIKEFPYM